MTVGTKRRLALGLAVVGVCLGAGSALADWDPSTDYNPDANPAATAAVDASSPTKEQEVASATDSSDPLSNPPDAAQLMDPFTDSGPAADVAKVKSDVVGDERTDRAIMGPSKPPTNLQDLLGAVWSSAVLTQVVKDTLDGMLAAAQDPTYQPYSDNSFTVGEWQGVRVTGTTAFALFMGYDSYQPAGGSTVENDPTRQWQVQLSLEAGRWKLVSQQEVDPGDSPPPGGLDSLP